MRLVCPDAARRGVLPNFENKSRLDCESVAAAVVAAVLSRKLPFARRDTRRYT
jgi:hypothetical protein